MSCSVIIPLLFTKLANKARGMCPVDAFSYSGSGTSKHAGNWNLEDDASTCSAMIPAVGMFIVCKVFLPSTRSKPSKFSKGKCTPGSWYNSLVGQTHLS